MSVENLKESSAPVLVTGHAGFIGGALTHRLLESGIPVVGLDNVNSYYDVRLKRARLERLQSLGNLVHYERALDDRPGVFDVFERHRPRLVVNLAGQAGVRHSLVDPFGVLDSNVVGFLNVLEACRRYPVEHLLYASSSSVYGANDGVPSREDDAANKPLSLYGASKKANEVMAHSYSHLFGIPATGLRFFSVYGPWGRPDMALWLFTEAILESRPIQLFNYGKSMRDFTYVDDVVEALARILSAPQKRPPAGPPHRIYNVGNGRPEVLRNFLAVLEKALDRTAQVTLHPMQPGDSQANWADVSALAEDYAFRPVTAIETGIPQFVRWYLEYTGRL